MKRAASILFLLLVLLVPRVALGHGMRTGTLRVEQVTATRAIARWATTIPDESAAPELPPTCQATALDDAPEGARFYTLACPQGLAGATLGVRGLGPVLSEATIFVRFADGRTASRLLTPEAASWTLPAEQSRFDVARSYVRAGVLHIATGADHLLFLVLLVLTLRRPRAVLAAETAFTLSHSFAFTATSLGWIHVAAAPAEACIALSLVLLALDVRSGPGDAPAERSRRAWRGALGAFVFGLVHGLGFAGGLREMGLPDTHVATALVGFGAGVELGQVAFLVLALVVFALVSRLRVFPRLVDVAAVAIGALATAWLAERLLVVIAA